MTLPNYFSEHFQHISHFYASLALHGSPTYFFTATYLSSTSTKHSTEPEWKANAGCVVPSRWINTSDDPSCPSWKGEDSMKSSKFLWYVNADCTMYISYSTNKHIKQNMNSTSWKLVSINLCTKLISILTGPYTAVHTRDLSSIHICACHKINICMCICD